MIIVRDFGFMPIQKSISQPKANDRGNGAKERNFSV